MDYKQAVKNEDSRLSELDARMDADVLLRDLEKYIMKGMDARGFPTNKIPNIVNVTLNRPAVYYYNIVSALGSTSEQVIVESEDDKLDTAYIEDFQKAAFASADAKLKKGGFHKLNPYFDDQACIRGRIAARCLFQMVDGVLIPDIKYWDTRYVRYGMGVDGLEWASYETLRSKSDIESEPWAEKYGVKVSGKEAKVLDIWHKEGSELYVADAKIFEQPHAFGFTPVAIEIVSLGSMLSDKDNVAREGESLFFLIRGVIPELNRLASIVQTLNTKSALPPMKQKKRGGGTASKHEDITAMGANTAMEPDEDVAPIDFGDAQRSATIALGMFDEAMREGSLSSADLGTIGSPPASGIRAIIAGENKDQIVFPRLNAKAGMNEQLAEMFTAQVIQIGGSVELGDKGHKRTFDTGKLNGEYSTTFKYKVKSAVLDAGLYSLAASAGNLIPNKAKRTEILQREDPEGDEEQLRIEEAERLSPGVKRRRTIEALIKHDRPEEAEIMSDEAGIELEKLLAGEIPQLPTEKPQEPKQVLSLFGGATGGQPTQREEE